MTTTPAPRTETNPDCPHGLRFAARRCSVCGRRPVVPVNVAWDRAETDACEKGTPGCSVRHPVGPETECAPW